MMRFPAIVAVIAIAVIASCDCINPITASRVDIENDCVDWDSAVNIGCGKPFDLATMDMMSCLKNRKTGVHVCMGATPPGEYYEQWVEGDEEICAICFSGESCE